MKPYLAQMKSSLRLMARDRSVLFFSMIFPLTFFFVFAQIFEAEKSASAMYQVIAAVTVIGVLGSGFFGAGLRTIQDRETNILRRFKVAPISPGPVIVASLVSGLVNFVPVVVLFLVFAQLIYHIPLPPTTLSLLLFTCFGVLAFRAIGMIVASVVNSAQEGNILVQLLYLPMLFLSGATFPLTLMPSWLQVAAQFLPATYVHEGVAAILIGGESIWANWFAVFALILATVISVFVGIKLFRWEKEEKISSRSKLWILGVLTPFLLLGLYQAKTKEVEGKNKILARTAMRSRTLLFKNAHIFVGDGRVIENGSVLVRAGKIAQVFDKGPADSKSLRAEEIDASGKTLLPGLIDMHVHIGAPGGIYKDSSKYGDVKLTRRRMAAYLYSGTVAVRSTGDWLDSTLELRRVENTGEELGAELLTCGPIFTAPGGHPTELLDNIPKQLRNTAEAQFVRLPATADQARKQVDDLKARHVDCIKSVLESGWAGIGQFNHLDAALYTAVMQEAGKDGLLTATHTGSAADVLEAVNAGSTTVEHGSWHEAIPASTLAAMKARGTSYDPTLSVIEAFIALRTGDLDVFNRPMVKQIGPPDLLAQTREHVVKAGDPSRKLHVQPMMEMAAANLLAAYRAGVPLIAGSDAGNMLVMHGPTVQRELALWVQHGIPAGVALQAATYNAARALGEANRLGLIAPGHDASFIVVDGDAVTDITSLEHISTVLFKGERVDRSELLTRDKT